jgi:hypothetical protein
VFSQFSLEIFIDFYVFTKTGKTLQIFITILDFLHSFRIALINLCYVVLKNFDNNNFLNSKVVLPEFFCCPSKLNVLHTYVTFKLELFISHKQGSPEGVKGVYTPWNVWKVDPPKIFPKNQKIVYQIRWVLPSPRISKFFRLTPPLARRGLANPRHK